MQHSVRSLDAPARRFWITCPRVRNLPATRNGGVEPCLLGCQVCGGGRFRSSPFAFDGHTSAGHMHTLGMCAALAVRHAAHIK